jgi:chromosome partitioning protein
MIKKEGAVKVISIVNQKGGCGKTIISINLSSALSKKYKILLVDFDPQGHTTFSLRSFLSNFDESFLTLSEGLEEISKEESLKKECFKIKDNLYILPSSLGLVSLEQNLSSHPEKLSLLRHLLEKLNLSFDYVILDCPPNLGILTLNALVASDYSFIPLLACDFSLRGIEILQNILIMIKEFRGKSPTFFYILNQVDYRSKFGKEFVEKVNRELKDFVLKTTIRTNIYLREAVSEGKDIFSHKPKSRGAEDFTLLAKEVEEITNTLNWTSLFFKGQQFNQVYVVGDFNQWQKKEEFKLKRIGEIWSINLKLEKGIYRYKFLAEDRWLSDPYNKLTENDPFGGKNSLLVVE